MFILVRKVMPSQEDESWKVVGSNPGAKKWIFLAKSLLNWNWTIYCGDVHYYTGALCNLLIVMCCRCTTGKSSSIHVAFYCTNLVVRRRANIEEEKSFMVSGLHRTLPEKIALSLKSDCSSAMKLHRRDQKANITNHQVLLLPLIEPPQVTKDPTWSWFLSLKASTSTRCVDRCCFNYSLFLSKGTKNVRSSLR